MSRLDGQVVRQLVGHRAEPEEPGHAGHALVADDDEVVAARPGGVDERADRVAVDHGGVDRHTRRRRGRPWPRRRPPGPWPGLPAVMIVRLAPVDEADLDGAGHGRAAVSEPSVPTRMRWYTPRTLGEVAAARSHRYRIDPWRPIPHEAIRDIALGFPEADREGDVGASRRSGCATRSSSRFGVDDDGRAQVTMKAAPGEQESLLAEGEPFFLPKYVGVEGLDRHPRRRRDRLAGGRRAGGRLVPGDRARRRSPRASVCARPGRQRVGPGRGRRRQRDRRTGRGQAAQGRGRRRAAGRRRPTTTASSSTSTPTTPGSTSVEL